jgi:hypothetical protein
MMVSFKELQAAGLLSAFKKAIDEKDLLEIIKCLKNPLLKISHEMAVQLADFLDPNGAPRKTGTKPSLTRLKQKRNYEIVFIYKHLCKNLEFARYFLNPQKYEFDLVEGEDLTDADGSFAPVWKHPGLDRTRNETLKPKRSDIKTYLCERYRIKSRTFDTILRTQSKKRKAET